MSTPTRPSPLSFNASSGRQSPFKRQNSTATARATTPTPTSLIQPKSPHLSPTKAGSLSPEKTSPFARRPSQISQVSERPASPLPRPSSSLSIPATSPSRQSSNASVSDSITAASPVQNRASSFTPDPESLRSDEPALPSTTNRLAASLQSFDGPKDSPTYDSPSSIISQTARSTNFPASTTASTTSTIRPPKFTAQPPVERAPRLDNSIPGYGQVPQALLHSMRESFSVLDESNTGSITSASISSMLAQLNLPNKPRDVTAFFPPSAPAQLNLARYLDTLAAPISELSPPDELAAAFEAFDVDDSGQINAADLRKALMDQGMSETELDDVMGDFVGRRAFGSRGLNVEKGRGEVFRYRDFVGAIRGGAAEEMQPGGQVMA